MAEIEYINIITKTWFGENKAGNWIRIWEYDEDDYFWECGFSDGSAFNSDGSDTFQLAKGAALESLGKDGKGIYKFIIENKKRRTIK